MSTVVPTSAMSAAQAFFVAYDGHDIDGMLRLCTVTAQLRHVPMGRLETGSIHVVGRKAWSDMFSALPDLRVTVVSAASNESRVGAEVIIADRKRGFELPQAYFVTVDGTYRITNLTVYWDNVTLGLQMAQAGAVRLVDALKRRTSSRTSSPRR